VNKERKEGKDMSLEEDDKPVKVSEHDITIMIETQTPFITNLTHRGLICPYCDKTGEKKCHIETSVPLLRGLVSRVCSFYSQGSCSYDSESVEEKNTMRTISNIAKRYGKVE